MQDLPIDGAHGIQKDACVMARIKSSGLNHNVPTILITIKIIDVAPSYGEVMDAFPNIEYMASHVGKVRICSKMDLEAIIGSLLKVAP